MKNFFLLAIAVFFSFSVLVAQSNNSETKENETEVVEEVTPKEGPQATFKSKEIDYGKIEQNADPYRIFTFENTGTEPLLITDAKGSCGCTVPTYPKEPIGPGESGEIKVRYATNRIGAFRKTVTLTTNSIEQKITLTIKGEVKAKPAEPEAIPANEETNPFKIKNTKSNNNR